MRMCVHPRVRAWVCINVCVHVHACGGVCVLWEIKQNFFQLSKEIKCCHGKKKQTVKCRKNDRTKRMVGQSTVRVL